MKKTVADLHCPFPHRCGGPVGSISTLWFTSDGVLSPLPTTLTARKPPSRDKVTDSGNGHSTLVTALVTLRGNGRRQSRTGVGAGGLGKAACTLSQYPLGPEMDRVCGVMYC